MTDTIRVLLQESATAVEAATTPLVEAGATLVPDPVQPTGGARRYSARILEADRWGSSGYYAATTLAEAAQRKVFAEGTQVFVNHPRYSDDMDQRNRDVHDLAGKLVTDAVMEADGLHAEIEFYPHYAHIVEAMKDDIGLSIMADGQAEVGEAAGRKGPLITRIESARSVDIVHKAGAGGKLISLLESARVAEAATEDERDMLQRALPQRSWLHDFDPTAGTAWFARYDDSNDRRRIWQQPYTVDGQTATFTGTPVEVRVVTTYQPLTGSTDPSTTVVETATQNPPAGSAGVTPIKENHMEITEAEHAALTDRAARVDALEAELATRDARQAATERASKPLGESSLPESARVRVLREAITDLPLTEARALNEGEFDTRLTAAIEAEKAYIAGLTPEHRVTGFGTAAAPATPTNLSEAVKAVPFTRPTVKGA